MSELWLSGWKCWDGLSQTLVIKCLLKPEIMIITPRKHSNERNWGCGIKGWGHRRILKSRKWHYGWICMVCRKGQELRSYRTGWLLYIHVISFTDMELGWCGLVVEGLRLDSSLVLECIGAAPPLHSSGSKRSLLLRRSSHLLSCADGC